MDGRVEIFTRSLIPPLHSRNRLICWFDIIFRFRRLIQDPLDRWFSEPTGDNAKRPGPFLSS